MTSISVAVVAQPLRSPFSRHLSPNKLSLLQITRTGLRRKRLGVALAAATASESSSEATYDPDLRLVFDLATDSELYELEKILFGPSYFSPLLKSIPNKGGIDRLMIGQDIEVRDGFIESLESRFLFLAADARSTLRGWRPSYRNVLLAVRNNLNIPCSSQLPTEDLEAEIFLYLVIISRVKHQEFFQAYGIILKSQRLME